ncbi:uncharacterized protein LOC133515576 [Cydia pomonella]|uniref:uncharacterized protein LOC133515576 n=1 Tax=Cydia pomonella TaxID=82600 RepID=UPI002ADE074A|nr:uncharacterized protein LOC133515576 [Cydia pomonella]
MLEPWNDASLRPPPVHTFLCHRKVDIQDIKNTCRNMIKVLSNQSPLHKESAILSRFAYKYDKKFRNDIGYRHFKKVNVALRCYLGLNVLKDIENFSDTLPADDEDYLPTRQMLQYIMIRLITFAKIMVRVCVCSKQASVFYLDRIKCGEGHWMSLMPYAVLSRVWSLCTVLLRNACAWYARLRPWLVKLQLKGVEFLPDNYNLPVDLEVWLDLKNIDSFGRFEWAPNKCLTLQQSLIVDDDDDNTDSFMDYVKQLNEDDTEEPITCNLKSNLSKETPSEIQVNPVLNKDKGESISRESFKAPLNSTSKPNTDKGETISRESFKRPLHSQSEPLKRENTYNHSPGNVTDTESLKKFMLMEESFRNEKKQSSLTSHLSFMQWTALKNSLDTLANSLSNKRKIEKKFKRIWKEKCIDYS